MIYQTTNGGTDWSSYGSIGMQPNRIKFYSSTLGMIAGEGGTVVITKDGGATWSYVSTGQTGIIFDFVFISATEIWGAAETGIVIHSTDGGSTWSTTTINGFSSFLSTSLAGSNIFIAGEYGIIISKDVSAASWSAIVDPSAQSTNWISFSDANTGYAVGQYGYIAKTSDKGVTWTQFQDEMFYDTFYGVQAKGTGSCWVAGEEGVIFHTPDGGSTWEQQTTGLTTTLTSLSFVDTLNGWAAGDTGVILHTADGGATWSKQTSGTTSNLFGIYFRDSNKGWCVGSGGIMLRTTNGGSSWSTMTSVTTNNLNSITMVNANLGFAVGASGVILKSSDGGAGWALISNDVTEDLTAITGSSASNVYAVGNSGTVLYSTDSGTTWAAQFAATYYNLYGAAIVDSTLYICGDNSTIMTNNLAQITDVREAAVTGAHVTPAAFALGQNYPNPFNPSTTIQYEVKKSGWVNVKVFDVTGRLVASPVHKEESIGTHSFRFNAAGLPSGIYYYTLSLNGTMQTRKMVLLK